MQSAQNSRNFPIQAMSYTDSLYLDGESSDVEDLWEAEEEAMHSQQAGKLVVFVGEEFLRCPFCPNKRKQAWRKPYLLAHAKGQAQGQRDNMQVASKHSVWPSTGNTSRQHGP